MFRKEESGVLKRGWRCSEKKRAVFRKEESGIQKRVGWYSELEKVRQQL